MQLNTLRELKNMNTQFGLAKLLVVMWLGAAGLVWAAPPSSQPYVLNRVDLSPGALPQNDYLDHAKQVFGSTVSVDNNDDVEEMYSLVANDEALPYDVVAGRNMVDVTFQNTTTINRINVINLKVRGTAQVFVSELPDGSGNSWRQVSKPVQLSSKGVTPINFGSVVARSARVVINATSKGNLGPIEAFGDETIFAIAAVESPPLQIQREPTVREVTNQLSACSLLTYSRVTHTLGASPKDSPNRMIDGDADSQVVFEGAGPKLAIIDMSMLEPIRRVTFLTSPGVQSIDMVPLMTLDDGELARAFQILMPEYPTGGASSHLALKLLPLAIGRPRKTSLSDMPPSVTLPGNYFNRSNAFNVPIGGGNYVGALNMETTPAQYLVLRVNASGSGPVAIGEVNAYTDPRERRWGAEPDGRPDNAEGFLDNKWRTTRVPLISK